MLTIEAKDAWGDMMDAAQRDGVLIQKQGQPAVVAISASAWDEHKAEIERLRRIVNAQRKLAEMRAGEYTDFADIEAEFSDAPSL